MKLRTFLHLTCAAVADRCEFAEVRYRIEKGRAHCIRNTNKKH